MMFMNFRMNKIQWGAFLVSALCIFAMSVGPSNKIEGGTPLLGYLFVTCSVLSIACTAHLRASLADKYGSVVSMLMQYIAVAIFGLVMVLSMGLELSQITIILSDPLLICLLVFLGTGISGVSYLIQLYSFKKIGVEKSSLSLNLMPLVGYIVAVLALGEELSFSKTAVVLTIVIALYVFNVYESKDKTVSINKSAKPNVAI